MKKKLLKKMYAEFEAKENVRKQRKKDIKKCLKIQVKFGVENPTPIHTHLGKVITDKCEIKRFIHLKEEMDKKLTASVKA